MVLVLRIGDIHVFESYEIRVNEFFFKWGSMYLRTKLFTHSCLYKIQNSFSFFMLHCCQIFNRSRIANNETKGFYQSLRSLKKVLSVIDSQTKEVIYISIQWKSLKQIELPVVEKLTEINSETGHDFKESSLRDQILQSIYYSLSFEDSHEGT